MAGFSSNPVSSENQATVSQSEIERLLAQVGDVDSPTEQDESSSTSSQRNVRVQKPELIQRHVFPQFSFFSGGELRKLRVRHEEFIRSLSAQLSIYLRLEFGLQMSKLETSPLDKFVEGLANPTHLTSFKLEPLQGTCLLEISPRLAFGIVDRQLGGLGRCGDESRDLSEIELRLLSRFVEIILSEWCNFWSGMLDLRPVRLGSENNSRSIQASAPETTMLILGMEARLGDAVDQIQFAFPSHTLEPLMLKLNSKHESEADKAATFSKATRLKWNPVLADMKMNVTAELPPLEFSTREVSQLKLGDFLVIDPKMLSQIQVCIEKVPKFLATLGSLEDRRAAKITEVLKS